MAAWRYEISLLVLKNIFIFQHEKKYFVSPSGHVISSILFTDLESVSMKQEYAKLLIFFDSWWILKFK